MKIEEKSAVITTILPDIPMDKIDWLESLLAEKDSALAEKDFKILTLEKELRWLKEQCQLMRQRQFGRSTEKSNVLQEELVFDEVPEAIIQADELAAIATEEITYTRRKVKACGRKLDTSRLPRERCIHDLSDAEKICGCGCRLEKIGEDVSEQIDHIPEQLKVIEHVRVKYTCRHCETIKTAPKPETPLTKSMASANLITDVIVKKYEHHLPLYRQSKLLFEQGLEIPDNTLANWVMGAAEVLWPLQAALWLQLKETQVLQVDETPVKVLKPDKQGYLWGYHSCQGQRFIVFEFTLTRAGEHPQTRLKNYQGILQTDAYSGYNTLRQQPSIIPVGCWDHSRRKFMEVVKICGHNKAGKAGEMLIHIGKLYEIERAAKDKTAMQRQQLRQEKSKPVLSLIHSRLQKINAPPQSALGKAVQYALNQWPYLSNYIDYGEVEISNCWIENQIRPFALGRRNWLFVGNEASANKSALLYSLIQTCKLNHINPRNYLSYVLKQVHRMRRQEIDPVTLLPQFIDKSLLV